jgi:hypothetical protein
VWAVARAGDGTLYLGTDDGGAIYQLRGEKASKLVAIDGAVAVVALALAADGALYAGTMPGGQVWKVDPKAAKATLLATLDEVETVWALCVDDGAKQLYAGTGPQGKLFQIELATGKAKVAFASEDKRVLALTRTGDGAIWLGTSEKALLFRHDPKTGTTRAMADFSGNEITALAELDGGVVALANEFDEPSTSGAKTKAAIDKTQPKEDGEKGKAPKTDSKPGADKPPSSAAEIPRPGARKGKGSLYRVYGDNRLELVHTLSQTYFSALAVTEKGEIFAGAGDKGRIYLIDREDAVSTVFDVAERMVSQLVYDPRGGLAFFTGDATAFYRSTERAKKSTYVSKTFDSKAVSRFGKLAWRGRGAFQLETRTGNTAEPGVGWSEWQAPAQVAETGGGERAGRVASPTGRYLQFRVTFAGDPDAVLRKVTAYYLPQNQATEITEVTVGDGGGRGPLVTTKSGEAKPRSPVVKIKWKVDNDDGDATAYTLAVRREGDVDWRPIATGKKPYTDTSFDWNTETFPDGYYRLRITASDRLANAAARAREEEKISDLYRVDNTRPEIANIQVVYPNGSARASDALSAIAEMAYSLDDQPWRIGDCQDGLFDQQTEILKLDLAPLDPGTHTLAIRVADEAGNIGSAAVTFQVK